MFFGVVYTSLYCVFSSQLFILLTHQTLTWILLLYGCECFTNNQNIHRINTITTSANGVVCLSYVTQMAILSNKVTIPCLFKLWGMNFVCVLFGILNSCKICFGKQWRCKCTSQTTREQENQNGIHFHSRFSMNSWKLQQNSVLCMLNNLQRFIVKRG